MKAVYLHLTEEMVNELDKKAKERGVPRASIIKQYIDEGLTKNE